MHFSETELFYIFTSFSISIWHYVTYSILKHESQKTSPKRKPDHVKMNSS